MVANQCFSVLFEFSQLSVQFLLNEYAHTHTNVCPQNILTSVLNDGDYEISWDYDSDYDICSFNTAGFIHIWTWNPYFKIPGLSRICANPVLFLLLFETPSYIG